MLFVACCRPGFEPAYAGLRGSERLTILTVASTTRCKLLLEPLHHEGATASMKESRSRQSSRTPLFEVDARAADNIYMAHFSVVNDDRAKPEFPKSNADLMPHS